MEEEIEELLSHLEDILCQQRQFEMFWIGRRVRLKEALGSFLSPTGEQVLLRAGAVGWIVNFQMNPTAPFVIEFSGFPYRVVPMVEKLEFLD